jgi:hypothetical protein
LETAVLLSVFTPSHNPYWIRDAYESLMAQNDVNWEWVIVPSREGLEFPKELKKDPRVKFHPCMSDKIGELKRFACGKAEGDVYVELDHDDMLAPGILKKVETAAKAGAGFIFSDTSVFLDHKGNRWTYGYAVEHGWERYTANAYGKNWVVSRAFPVTPRSLCEVFHAPDHVRCWSKTAYWDAGGHNPDLEAGDDHDLMCRTYINHHKFHHIPECGYLYRMHDENSFKKKNEPLIHTVFESRAKYLSQLIAEWCTRTEVPLVSLDDGGYEEAMMYPNNTLGCVISTKHINTVAPESLSITLNDFYGRLVPGGWLMLEVDPEQHPEEAFYPATKRAHVKDDPYMRCRFQSLVYHMKLDIPEGSPPVAQVVLCALKGQRQPGKVEI